MLAYKICLFSTLLAISAAFAPHSNGARSATAPSRKLVGGNLNTAIHSASVSEGGAAPLAQTSDDAAPLAQTSDEDDDEEWELEEFENLTEPDFYGSEWKIGTLMDGKKKIVETWCRCVVKEDGQFLAIWGDGAEGKWNFDSTNQFFSISKDTFGGWFGKQIWAGAVEDYYFMEGTVRGWSPLSPASVVGQWQMKRLGIDPDEAGVAPWFETEDEATEDEENNTEIVSKETEDEEKSTDVIAKETQDEEKSTDVIVKETQDEENSTDVVAKETKDEEKSTEVVAKETQDEAKSTDVVAKETQDEVKSTKVAKESDGDSPSPKEQAK